MEHHRLPRPQHLVALDRANTVRRRRYALRRRVVRRELSLLAVFTPDAINDAERNLIADRSVRELLEWGHRIGGSVSRDILRSADVRPNLALSSLAPSRLEAIRDAIQSAAPEACTGANELTPELVATMEAELDAPRKNWREAGAPQAEAA